MEKRFFVTIFAADQSALKNLTNLNFDTYGTSIPKKGEPFVHGLLSKAQITKAQKAGFRVEVREEHIEQARRSEITASSQVVDVMDDKQWLEEFYKKKKVK